MYFNLKSKRSLLGAIPLIALLLTPTLSAGPLFGTFGIAGPGVLAFKLTGSPGQPDFIRFCTYADPNCQAAAGATGDFVVSGPGQPATSPFSVLAPLTLGTIKNMTDTTPPTPPYTYFPTGVPGQNIQNFITVSGHPNWDFIGDLLQPASCITTATQKCIGPFQFNQNAQNVGVTIDITGFAKDTNDNTVTNLDISITGQYNNTTIDNVIAQGTTPTGAFSNSWSGTVSALTVPEPGALSLTLLGGLFFAASVMGRKLRR